jgi:aryl-alcohol dehydrogenase-like predicted oxidoreductase
MNKRKFGGTGLHVSEIGLGAWPIGNNGIGEYGAIEEEDAVQLVRRYVDLGGNFIDTARAYGERSERIIGQTMKRYFSRERVIIASKTVAGETKDSIAKMRLDLEESLRLLQTEYIDLYQLHQPPEKYDDMMLALDEMEKFRAEGKIHFIGASIKGPDVTDATIKLCQQYMDTKRLDAIQLVYSILRQKMKPIIRQAQEQDIGIIIRTVLESGLLTGEYKPGHVFSGIDQRTRYRKDHLDFILDSVAELKRELNFPVPYEHLSQIAIKFSLSAFGGSTFIIGAQKPAEVEENIRVAGFPDLPNEIIDFLEKKFSAQNDMSNYK